MSQILSQAESNLSPLHFRIAGVSAILTAGCAVAGAAVSLSFGLGGQNLPVETHEQLAQLAGKRTPFLIREWFYLAVAVFGLGEGVGLYFLLRKSPLAIWALIAWLVGLTIGIVEDSAVIALVVQVSHTFPGASDSLRDSMLFTSGVAFETIKVQQFVAILLCCPFSYSVFSIVGYRARLMPLWMCIVGVLGGVMIGCFAFCNIASGFDRVQPLFENGFTLMVIWDFAVGVLLLSSAKRLSGAT